MPMPRNPSAAYSLPSCIFRLSGPPQGFSPAYFSVHVCAPSITIAEPGAAPSRFDSFVFWMPNPSFAIRSWSSVPSL